MEKVKNIILIPLSLQLLHALLPFMVIFLEIVYSVTLIFFPPILLNSFIRLLSLTISANLFKTTNDLHLVKSSGHFSVFILHDASSVI